MLVVTPDAVTGVVDCSLELGIIVGVAFVVVVMGVVTAKISRIQVNYYKTLQQVIMTSVPLRLAHTRYQDPIWITVQLVVHWEPQHTLQHSTSPLAV